MGSKDAQPKTASQAAVEAKYKEMMKESMDRLKRKKPVPPHLCKTL